MAKETQFTVIDLPNLEWPASLNVATRRFRLFVAADTLDTSADEVSSFAVAALNAGMVYRCVWGQGCERFHDMVDECINEDDAGPRKFAGATDNDVVMTTWHDNESLQQALDFFVTSAVPTDGFAEGSDFWIVVCVGHHEWAASAKECLAAAQYFI